MPVKFRYLYRDADNYKEVGEAVFDGSRFPGDEQRLREASEAGDFVASQVGLDPLQPRMTSFPSPSDNGYHELISESYGIEEVEETPDTEAMADGRTWTEFVGGFEAAAAAGWDPEGECEELGIDLTAEWGDEESELE